MLLDYRQVMTYNVITTMSHYVSLAWLILSNISVSLREKHHDAVSSSSICALIASRVVK